MVPATVPRAQARNPLIIADVRDADLTCLKGAQVAAARVRQAGDHLPRAWLLDPIERPFHPMPVVGLREMQADSRFLLDALRLQRTARQAWNVSLRKRPCCSIGIGL
jgi:hypothetical protein